MTKSQMLGDVARRARTTKKTASEVIDALMIVTRHELLAGRRVVMADQYVVEPYIRPARKGRDPRTGADISIAEKKMLRIKTAKSLSTEMRERTWRPKAQRQDRVLTGAAKQMMEARQGKPDTSPAAPRRGRPAATA